MICPESGSFFLHGDLVSPNQEIVTRIRDLFSSFLVYIFSCPSLRRMTITIEGQTFSWEQIQAGKPILSDFSEESGRLIDFLKVWNQSNRFPFHSSGSTGRPRKIWLSKAAMTYSAEKTIRFLGLSKARKGRVLLCLAPDKIGGAMVAVRAMYCGFDLDVLPASIDFNRLQNHYKLASMVPLQIEKVLQTNRQIFNQFENILIGGAALNRSTENRLASLETKFYHTYGMTETASHVALRAIGEKYFKAIGDAEFQNTGGCLAIKGSVTCGQWLQTNDEAALIDKKTFVWIGRKDFIINSGAYKVNPEKVESELSAQLSGGFAISSVPDELYVEKVILWSEGEKLPLDFTHLHPYEKPRIFFWGRKIPKTSSGKVDRIKIKELAEQALKDLS